MHLNFFFFASGRSYLVFQYSVAELWTREQLWPFLSPSSILAIRSAGQASPAKAQGRWDKSGRCTEVLLTLSAYALTWPSPGLCWGCAEVMSVNIYLSFVNNNFSQKSEKWCVGCFPGCLSLPSGMPQISPCSNMGPTSFSIFPVPTPRQTKFQQIRAPLRIFCSIHVRLTRWNIKAWC